MNKRERSILQENWKDQVDDEEAPQAAADSRPESSAESSPEQEARRLEKMQALEKKVDIVGEMKAVLEDITTKTPPEQVHQQFQKFYGTVAEQFPKQNVTDARRLSETLTWLLAVQSQQRSDTPPGRLEKNFAAVNQADLERYQRNDDTRFLATLQYGLQKLAGRKEEVDTLNTSDTVLEKRMKDFNYLSHLNLENISEIIRKPFAEILVLADREFNQVIEEPDDAQGGGIHGRYYSGTPFAVVRDRDGFESTVQHEYNHVLLEYFVEHQLHAMGPFMETLQDAVHHPKYVSGETRASLLRQLQETNWDHIIDATHNEILAHWRSIESDFLYEYDRISGNKYQAAERYFDDIVDAFSTSGSTMMDIINFLDNSQTSDDLSDDQEIQRTLGHMKESLKARFLHVIGQLRESYLLAHELGPEAVEQHHSLIHILKPSQFASIRKFFVYKFGSDEVAEAERVYEFFDRFSLRIDWFKMNIESIDAGSSVPIDEEKRRKIIAHIIDGLEGYSSEEYEEKFGIVSFADLVEYKKIMAELYRVFGFEESTDQLLWTVQYEGMWRCLNNPETRSSQGLSEFFLELPSDLQEKFSQSIEDGIGRKLEEKFYNNNRKKIKLSTVINWPVMSMLAAASLNPVDFIEEEVMRRYVEIDPDSSDGKISGAAS